MKPGASTAEPWIQPDNETSLGVFGLFADEKASTLWACFSPIPGQHGATANLKAFDLQSGALKGAYPLPGTDPFCNDIAVGSDGTAYISDTSNMQVDRLASGGHQLEVWAGNGAFGPKGGVLDGISVLGNRLLVNTLVTCKVFGVSIEGTARPELFAN